MTSFFLAMSALIVIALLIVWRIFTASKHAIGAENANIRQETNVTLYHEHLKSLETDLAEGSIGEESFVQLKAELDKTLLQDVNADDSVAVVEQRTSYLWPMSIGIVIIGLSIFMYSVTGAYQALYAPETLKQDHHGQLSPEQLLAVEIEKLEQEIAKNPENTQALFTLGQAFISAGLFDEAVKAFDGVIEKVGEHAELLGPKAQALYYKNNQKINAQIQSIIERALVLDPLDSATNILLGMDSFTQRNFAKAVEHWEMVLNSGRPGISVQALTGAVNEAKNQLRISQELPLGSEQVSADSSSKARVVVDVTLADDVIAQLMSEDDKTVFVYAIAANGPRMPLAAVKISASDLPIQVVLDDSQAMTPQMRLSDVEKVNIYAVVSMQGGVGMKPGDFKAEAIDIDINQSEPIALEIATKVQ